MSATHFWAFPKKRAVIYPFWLTSVRFCCKIYEHKSYICRCGGIGRRPGLKIPWWQHRTGSIPVSGTRKETPFVYRTKGVSFQRNKSLRICEMPSGREIWLAPCEMPAGVRGFISFHFPHKRKISQWPKVIISYPKDISLHNPSFLLYYQFNKLEFAYEK